MSGLLAARRKINQALKIRYKIEFNHKRLKMVTGVISPGVFKHHTNLRGISGTLVQTKNLKKSIKTPLDVQKHRKKAQGLSREEGRFKVTVHTTTSPT